MKRFFKKFRKLISSKENLKGFTLTELLVTVAILVILIGAVYLSYNLSQKAYSESERAAEIIQNGRVVLERIVREIRQAKEIVTELSDEKTEAVNLIEFQDGHEPSYIHYLRYYLDTDQTIKREDVAYYFSDSGDPASSTTYIVWDAIPPGGEELASTTLQGPEVIGEYISDLGFWGSKNINIFLILEKKDKTINLESGVFGRNL